MRSVLKLLGVSAVSMLVVSPSSVDAQGTAAPTQPAAPGWIFTPSIAFGGSWDSNVLLVNPGTNPPADYGSPISPSASLDYTGKYTRFSSGYYGSFVRYFTLDDLNSFQQSLRAMVEHRVSAKYKLFGQESFNAAPTTDVLQLAGVPFYRIGSRSNAAGGGFQAELSRHNSLRGVYTLRSVAFDLNRLSENQLQGGHAHELTFAFDHSLSRRLLVGGEYEFTRAIVNGTSFLGTRGPEDRFNMQTGSLTAQYQAGSSTTLSGGVGVSQLGAGLTHEARTGPQWRAAIAHRVGRGLVSASFRRSYIPSFGFGGTFQNEQWMTNVHAPLGHSRAYVDGGISWLNNDPLDGNQPSLHTAWLSSSIGYYATRWLTLEGFYGRTQQDSQLAGGQLERNQLGFRVLAAKPVKLR
jgi:hypothetical protein